jgi:hypothetical protein
MTVGEVAASIIGKNGALGRSERLQHRSTDQIDGTGGPQGLPKSSDRPPGGCHGRGLADGDLDHRSLYVRRACDGTRHRTVYLRSQRWSPPVAIVISAAFWTWLWGPVGLLMSTADPLPGRVGTPRRSSAIHRHHAGRPAGGLPTHAYR